MRLLLLFLPLFVFAKVHYAKVEPYETITIKSAVSGEVKDISLSLEGTQVFNKRVVYIDDFLDKINLKTSLENKTILEEITKLNKESLENLKETYKRQKSYYLRMNRLSTVSKTQKDNAFNSYSSAKVQYLSTKEKILSLEQQLLDLKYKISQLKKSIKDKSIILNGEYLYSILVKKRDFVAMGTPIAKIQDISRAKLVLYLEKEEIETLNNKKIYIDEEVTNYKVDKIWRITDEKFISLYKAEIYIKAPKEQFSSLVKVEIK